MSQGSYKLGRALGRQHVTVVVVILLLLGGGMLLEKAAADRRAQLAADATREEQARKAAGQAEEAKRRALLAENCAKDGAFHVKAMQELRDGQASAAFDTLYPCQDHFNDPAVKAVLVKAMTISRQKQEAEAKRILAAQKAEKKKHGVSVGMSAQDVLDSAWGRPEHVNRTTTSRGTREQWVYGGRNYLYFENGVLTAIQN